MVFDNWREMCFGRVKVWVFGQVCGVVFGLFMRGGVFCVFR